MWVIIPRFDELISTEVHKARAAVAFQLIYVRVKFIVTRMR